MKKYFRKRTIDGENVDVSYQLPLNWFVLSCIRLYQPLYHDQLPRNWLYQG